MRKNGAGFTLVEILVVISVLSIVGVIILTIFSQTLRGNNKAQILSAIKQNGQSVLENMDKNIRNSDSIVCISPDNSTLVVVKQGSYTRYKFLSGSIQQDFPTQPPPPASKADVKIFLASICTDTLGTDSLTPAQVLTDTNSQTGVNLISGSFTPGTKGLKDSVTISFQLGPGRGVSSSLSGQIDPVSFETTIQLR